MHRWIESNGEIGKISISNDAENACLILEIGLKNTAIIHGLISKVRDLFDLDSDPILIANSLELDPKLKALLKKHPGIRLPSGFDPFKVAIATILGQFVSVDRARQLVADLIDKLGKDTGVMVNRNPLKLFPAPEKIAASDLDGIKTTGMRKKTLIAFSNAVARGELSLESTQDVDEFIQKIQMIPGIGLWTANAMAMKVLRHADAFPETDLILARALKVHPKAIVDRMSPWRGYAAILFWKEYAQVLKKTKKKSRQ